MSSESSCEIPTSPAYTCAAYSGVSLNNSEHFSFTIPRITLIQQPNESLALTFSAAYYCDVDSLHSLFRYTLELHFENNLHESSTDYEYEILAQALYNDRHQQLFCQRIKREGASLEAQGVFSGVRSARAQLHHCCFCVRRLSREHTPRDYGSLLLRSGLYSDASLLVGGQEFRVHRELLAQASPVFRAMFEHDMIERQEGRVSIDDLDGEVVAELLAYLYEGRAAKIATMPRELFQAAHRYEIPGLREACEEQLLFDMNCRNVVDVLDTARLYELERLAAKAMEFVARHEEELVREDEFKTFLVRNLRTASVAATLKLCDKYDGLESVMSEALRFVKEHSAEMTEEQEFLGMFSTHPDLMRELFVYLHK